MTGYRNIAKDGEAPKGQYVTIPSPQFSSAAEAIAWHEAAKRHPRKPGQDFGAWVEKLKAEAAKREPGEEG